MPRIYTDVDTRQVLDRRYDAAIKRLKAFKGSTGSPEFRDIIASCDFYRDAYEAACRKWRENDMVLIDAETFINSGGNVALAIKEKV